MNIDWSELGACGGHASAKGVPMAIEMLFSGVLEERKKAYWEIDNRVVVQGDLYESAPYAARLIVDRIKADPGRLNGEVLDILFEIALGYAGEQDVQHGPLKGQSVQQLCRDTIAEVLPVLAAVRASAGDRERGTIDDLFAEYEEGGG